MVAVGKDAYRAKEPRLVEPTGAPAATATAKE